MFKLVRRREVRRLKTVNLLFKPSRSFLNLEASGLVWSLLRLPRSAWDVIIKNICIDRVINSILQGEKTNVHAIRKHLYIH